MTRLMKRPAWVLTVATVVWLARPSAQQGEPYRGASDLVSIFATVTDEAGRLVPDLTKRDFVVKDNGRKQPLTIFGNDAQPVSIVVMLDCSYSMAEHADLVREGAAEFITHLLPADRARIGSFAGQIRISPDTFTGDHARLLDALRAGLQPSGGSPIWTAIDRSITALLHEGGRRVVLVFTDGENAPQRGQVVTDLKDIIWRARVDDVMVYTIGFRDDTATPGFFRGPGRTRGGMGRSPQGPGGESGDEGARALKELAEQTGGGHFEMKALYDLNATFARVGEELHRQYRLGFVPQTLDDEMHKLEVSVQRPHMTVQARKNYFAGTLGR
jgi:VWFA-related protein